MSDKYAKRIREHNKAVKEVEHQLMRIAQRLCPGGHWMLQVEAREEYIGTSDEGKRITKPVYHVVAHNGDDNVTGCGNTLGAAAAHCIYFMLNGSVYPLTGNGGRFCESAWREDVEKAEFRGKLAGAEAALNVDREVEARLRLMGFDPETQNIPENARKCALEAVLSRI